MTRCFYIFTLAILLLSASPAFAHTGEGLIFIAFIIYIVVGLPLYAFLGDYEALVVRQRLNSEVEQSVVRSRNVMGIFVAKLIQIIAFVAASGTGFFDYWLKHLISEHHYLLNLAIFFLVMAGISYIVQFKFIQKPLHAETRAVAKALAVAFIPSFLPAVIVLILFVVS